MRKTKKERAEKKSRERTEKYYKKLGQSQKNIVDNYDTSALLALFGEVGK